MGVDILGLPHVMSVTTANVTDREGALEMLKNYPLTLSNIIKVLVDGGYSGEKFAESVKEIIGAVVEVAKRNELHKFAVIPKRWVVERTFAWLDKFRRFWKNCERKTDTFLQLIVIAFISLLLKRY